MQQVTVHTAKTRLSQLIEAAINGEEIVITKGSKPVVRLLPVPQHSFQIGLLAGRPGTGPDFLAPIDPTGLDLWEDGTS